MKANDFFSYNRFSKLMAVELFRMRKSMIITLGSTVGVMFVVSVLVSGFTPAINLQSFFFTGMFIAGIIIAGLAFPDFRKKETTISYLTLPASAFEKLVSQILIVSFGFLIFYIIAFYLFWVIVFLWRLFLQLDTPFYNVFLDGNFYESLFSLWFWQAVFLIGSASFIRMPLVKTLAAVFSVMIVLGIYLMFIITKIAFDNLSQHSHMMNSMYYNNTVFNTWLFYILTPVFWAISYFKIKEKQV